MPLAILTLIAALTASYTALSTPRDIDRIQQATADVLATNVIAYRKTLIAYQNANPSATGTIADGSLTFLPGHVRNATFTNVISGGTLYVYSTSTLAPGVIEKAWRYSNQSLLVGTKSASNTILVPGSGSSTTPVPATIPTGALVMVGQ